MLALQRARTASIPFVAVVAGCTGEGAPLRRRASRLQLLLEQHARARARRRAANFPRRARASRAGSSCPTSRARDARFCLAAVSYPPARRRRVCASPASHPRSCARASARWCRGAARCTTPPASGRARHAGAMRPHGELPTVSGSSTSSKRSGQSRFLLYAPVYVRRLVKARALLKPLTRRQALHTHARSARQLQTSIPSLHTPGRARFPDMRAPAPGRTPPVATDGLGAVLLADD